MPLPAAAGSGVLSPWNQLVPTTFSGACGAVTPMPTLPPPGCTMSGWPSVVPMKLVVGSVPALPVRFQASAPYVPV